MVWAQIGGSVRIPAHISGICSLKPTPGRMYMEGMRCSVGVGNQLLTNGIYSVNGFMAPNVDTLTVAMRAMLTDSESMARRDWRVVPLNWKDGHNTPERKLKVGWYDFDGCFPAAPSCKRAVHDVVKLLELDGHLVVPWTPPNLPKIRENFYNILVDNSAKSTIDVLKNEEVDPAINELTYIYNLPLWLKIIIAPLIRLFSKSLSEFFQSHPHSGEDVWRHNATRDNLIYEFTRSWESASLDVVICPGLAHPAFRPEFGNWLSGSSLPGTSYTAVYNVIGCPVGAVTVAKQTEDDDNLDAETVKKDLMNKKTAEVVKDANGCPVGIQVVGRHFQEETVLGAMKLIEDLNKKLVK